MPDLAADTESEQLVTLKSTPLLDFVAKSWGSPRLGNSLLAGRHAGTLPFATVRDYLEAGEQAEILLLGIPGLGQRTARELRSLVESAVAQASISTQLGASNEPACDPDGRLRTAEAVDELFNKLDPRERQVVAFRFALVGDKPKTLAQIGQLFGLTRERVRQIEDKGLRKLRAGGREVLISFLSARDRELWKRLTNGTGALGARDTHQAARKLTPLESLVIFLVHGSLETWLANEAQGVKGGWITKALDVRLVREASENLRQARRLFPEPVLLRRIAKRQSIDLALLRIATSLATDVGQYCGYLVQTPLRKRLRRVIRAHLLFSEQGLRMPIPVRRLREAYIARFQGDVCSIRDLEIVMGESRHLFLNMYEEGWVALGEIGELDCTLIEQREDVDDTARQESEPELAIQDTIAGSLRALLERRGPLQLDEVRRAFAEETRGRFSISSVGPILISRDGFVRFAPGVYGLRSQLGLPAALEQATHALLNASQLELYCHARWADEPATLYPMWTPQTEYAWAVWAKRNGLDVLLSSLLAVADIDSWPVSSDEKGRWVRAKERQGAYQLEENNPLPLTETLPGLDDMVAAGILARARGDVSWVSVNRVRGARVDDRHSHAVLSLLIGMGIVEAPSHWQRRHVLIDGACEIVDDLAAELEMAPSRRWTRGAVDLLVKYASREKELGWVHKAGLWMLIDEITLVSGHNRHSPTTLESGRDREPMGSTLDEIIEAVNLQRAFSLAEGKG